MFGQRRNSESDEASGWDSPSEVIQDVPKIEGSSADERPVRDTSGKRPTPADRSMKSPRQSEPQKSKRHGEGRGKKAGKEKPNDPLGGFTFTDRGGDSEEESVSVSISQSQPNKSKKRTKRNQKEETPPYDFKGALTDPRDREQPASRPPGKDRKGNTYDPEPSPRAPTAASGDTVALDSWDDSEAEERVLAELRQDLKKGQTTIDVEPEDQNQKSGSSFKSFKNLGSKLSQKFKKSPKHQANTSQEVLVENMPEQDNTSPLHHFAVVSKPNEDLNGKDPNQIKKERKVKTVVHHTDPDDNKYVYYFEDSSTEYYAARPDEVDAALPKIADKAEMISRRIALEFFGVLRLIVGFFIIFVVELYRFVMRHILHPILVGILVVTGDYLIKPVLSAIFNGILQPVSIFLYNLFVALRTGLNPLIDIINGFARQVAVILGAFRLVVVNNTHNHYERHVQDV